MTRPRFARDAASVLSSQYFTRAILLARGLVAAGLLGPARYGAWNALGLILEYGSYAGAGAVQGLDLALPPAVERGDRVEARRLMQGALSATLAGALLFTVLLAAYLLTGGRAFASAGARDLPWLMAVAAIGQVLLQYGTSALRALGRIPATSLAQALQAGIGGVLGLALVGRFGLHGLLWAWLAGTAVAWGVLRWRGPEVPWRPGAPRVGMRVLAIGAPLFGFFLCTLLLRSADRLALVRFGAPQALGLYSLAAIAAQTVIHVPESAAFVLLPRLAASAVGARDPERTRRETWRVQRALALLLPGVVAVAALLVEPLIAALLPAYRDGVAPLRILSIGALLLSASVLPEYALLAERRIAELIRTVIPGIAVGVALVFAWAARHADPSSVALAASAAYGLVAVLMLWRGLAAARLRGAEALSIVLASLIPALWASGLLLVAARWGDGTRLGVALLRSVIVLVAYAPMLWAFGRGLQLRDLWRRAHAAPPGRVV